MSEIISDLDDCEECCKCRCWCLECLFSAGFSLVSAVRGGGCAGASSPRGFQCPGMGQCWGPGPWTQPGCYPGHINLPSIYSVRPTSQGHGSYTGGKQILDPQFHNGSILCVICNLYKILIIQGVPHYCFHFVFVIFSGSRAHTEELFIAIG